MQRSDRSAYRGTFPIVTSVFLLCVVGLGTLWIMQNGSSAPPGADVPVPQSPFLAAAPAGTPKPFRLNDVPRWLFLHVGLIAGVQVLAILAAASRATRARTARDIRIVQFLVEVPMYLGLFGTLLGVCLTQFVSGALTAPMAYLTTMSGILLHVFGKLSILLPLPSPPELPEE